MALTAFFGVGDAAQIGALLLDMRSKLADRLLAVNARAQRDGASRMSPEPVGDGFVSRMVLGIDVERCANARKYSAARIGDAGVLG